MCINRVVCVCGAAEDNAAAVRADAKLSSSAHTSASSYITPNNLGVCAGKAAPTYPSPGRPPRACNCICGRPARGLACHCGCPCDPCSGRVSGPVGTSADPIIAAATLAADALRSSSAFAAGASRLPKLPGQSGLLSTAELAFIQSAGGIVNGGHHGYAGGRHQSGYPGDPMLEADLLDALRAMPVLPGSAPAASSTDAGFALGSRGPAALQAAAQLLLSQQQFVEGLNIDQASAGSNGSASQQSASRSASNLSGSLQAAPPSSARGTPVRSAASAAGRGASAAAAGSAAKRSSAVVSEEEDVRAPSSSEATSSATSLEVQSFLQSVSSTIAAHKARTAASTAGASALAAPPSAGSAHHRAARPASASAGSRPPSARKSTSAKRQQQQHDHEYPHASPQQHAHQIEPVNSSLSWDESHQGQGQGQAAGYQAAVAAAADAVAMAARSRLAPAAHAVTAHASSSASSAAGRQGGDANASADNSSSSSTSSSNGGSGESGGSAAALMGELARLEQRLTRPGRQQHQQAPYHRPGARAHPPRQHQQQQQQPQRAPATAASAMHALAQQYQDAAAALYHQDLPLHPHAYRHGYPHGYPAHAYAAQQQQQQQQHEAALRRAAFAGLSMDVSATTDESSYSSSPAARHGHLHLHPERSLEVDAGVAASLEDAVARRDRARDAAARAAIRETARRAEEAARAVAAANAVAAEDAARAKSDALRRKGDARAGQYADWVGDGVSVVAQPQTLPLVLGLELRGCANGAGCAVASVDPSGPAAACGIEVGDVVIYVNNRRTRTLSEYVWAAGLAATDVATAMTNNVSLQLLRGDMRFMFVVPIATDGAGAVPRAGALGAARASS